MSDRKRPAGQTPPRARTGQNPLPADTRVNQTIGETSSPVVRRGISVRTTPSNSEQISDTQEQRVPETPTDIVLTDYPNEDPLTDMSKAPLFFRKPGQFEQVTTWCEITFLTNTELSQDKAKQAAFFASLFRGPVLTWLAHHPDKDDLLRNYTRLQSEAKEHYTKSET